MGLRAPATSSRPSPPSSRSPREGGESEDSLDRSRAGRGGGRLRRRGGTATGPPAGGRSFNAAGARGARGARVVADFSPHGANCDTIEMSLCSYPTRRVARVGERIARGSPVLGHREPLPRQATIPAALRSRGLRSAAAHGLDRALDRLPREARASPSVAPDSPEGQRARARLRHGTDPGGAPGPGTSHHRAGGSRREDAARAPPP
jgi:hypothetical protein